MEMQREGHCRVDLSEHEGSLLETKTQFLTVATDDELSVRRGTYERFKLVQKQQSVCLSGLITHGRFH
jgi:hypothetical protein